MFDSNSSVLIISHITFRVVACTFFATTFLEVAVCLGSPRFAIQQKIGKFFELVKTRRRGD